MKYYLNDIKQQNNINPCHGCEMGSGSYSSGKDENGKYVEITSCKDTCPKYKKYLKDSCS